ncbi:lipoyl protein ligase domain-containing protein [Photobacterium sp.]|uniref:lipoyl protein ligase domain-containing protein n=1 Tax=Photobacterium sp. TaxID=660 RepID=UPI00299E8E4E|nr:lipoate protein ligase C-terminal domain-containing protein [Photobacterium sp.]MDX1303536.1 lipoate protein ligase C-terminal domain-containing protein [Photobacterium sp.]
MELHRYLSQSTNPWFNQAVEDVLFNSLSPGQCVLFVWRNRSSVNIGKDQNPWLVCNTRNVHRKSLSIVRRHTYGGAIYQDPGHTNFSLMGNANDINTAVVKGILTTLIGKLKIKAECNDNNEIMIGKKKISNTATSIVNGNFMQHCTIRVQTDLSAVEEFMLQHEENDNQTSSITTKYGNLCESNPRIQHETIERALASACSEHFTVMPQERRLNINPLPDLPGLGTKLHLISSWDWNYGQSPPFHRQLNGRFRWGTIQLELTIIKGTIAYIHCDCTNPLRILFNTFSERMMGYPYQAKSVMPVISTMMVDFGESQHELFQFARWLENEFT